MGAFILAILSGLGGIWATNIFTWKIKNKIDALDTMYLDILAIHREYELFYLLNINTPDKPVDISSKIIETSKIINPLIARLYLNCFIVDGRKAGRIYKKVSFWGNMVRDTINTAKVISPSDDQECSKFFIAVQDAIFYKRKEIISFCYMLKQFNPCNITCTTSTD